MNLFTPNEDGTSKCHEDPAKPSPATDNAVYLNVENYGFDRELKLNFCNKRQLPTSTDPVTLGLMCTVDGSPVTGPTTCNANAGNVGAYCAKFTGDDAATFASGEGVPEQNNEATQ